MGTAIITAVATAALLAIMALGFTTSYQTQVNVTIQSQGAIRLQGDRARTQITITSITYQGVQNLNVAVKNTGSTDVTQFARMDLIASYTTLTGQTVTRLQYTTNPAPAVNQWTVQSISPQAINGVWSPGGTMNIVAQLPQARLSGTGLLTISTPNGVTTSAMF